VKSVIGIRARPLDFIKAFLVLAIGGPIIFGGVALGTFFLVPLPTDVPEPRAGAIAQTSFVYAADGKTLIATFHAEHNREVIPEKQFKDPVYDKIKLAAVAAEDRRFFEHSGVDPKAILRAANADVRRRAVVQGGSTITQQYVKNAYIDSPQRTIFRKLREALYASQIERSLTKESILDNYLNTVYFGKGAYGVEAAAKTFFNKSASQISLSEAAQLIGLIPAPVSYSPYENPAGAENRRLFVIQRMETLTFAGRNLPAWLKPIDHPTAEQARAQKPVFHKPGEQVFQYPWFVDAVRTYLVNTYGESTVFSGGLRVTTTLEPRIQTAAEKAVYSIINKPEYPYAALASVDPDTGYIKALVGGRDYEQEKYNIAVQGRRQTGSAFKPFVLATALEEGISPSTRFRGPNRICLKGWKPNCPENFGSQSLGSITIETATIQSVNTVYAQLVLKVGPKKVVDMARRMGIPGPSWLPKRSGCTPKTGDACGSKVDAVPALTLGTEEVTPLEMASAFATLAARGQYRAPKIVIKVEDALGNPVPDRNGDVIPDGPSPPEQAMPAAVADTANKILEKVVTQGTARRANIARPAAAKTGTAQDFQNAYLVGYTPDLSAAVWMGYRDRNRKMTNVRGVGEVVGGSLPAMIWASYMREALKDVPESDFPRPGEILGPGGSRLRLPFRPRSPTPSPTLPAPEETFEPVPSPSPASSPSGPASSPPSISPSPSPT
jgi:penicillin-binding protein 1A